MNIVLFPKKKTESSSDYAYRVLKGNILNLHLKPAQIITEIETSLILKLSRTPLREAFILLEAENLIEFMPNKTTRVSPIYIETVDNSIFLRKVVEKEIIYLAMQEDISTHLNKMENIIEIQEDLVASDEDVYTLHLIDNSFHATLYESIGKIGMWKLLEKNSYDYHRLRQLNLLDSASAKEIIDQHKELVEIIRNKETNKVDQFVDKHLTNYMTRNLEILEEFGDSIEKCKGEVN